MLGFQGFPNLFAIQIEPRIVATVPVTREILSLRCRPHLAGGFGFRTTTAEDDRRKREKIQWSASALTEQNAGIAQLVEQLICNRKMRFCRF